MEHYCENVDSSFYSSVLPWNILHHIHLKMHFLCPTVEVGSIAVVMSLKIEA